MNKLKTLSVLLAALILGACGGGSDGCTGGTIAGNCGDTVDDSTPNAALVDSVTLFTSSPQLASDQTGNETITVTAVVQDSIGNLLSDVPVTFGTNNAALGVLQPVTDASGVATATVSSGGDPTNRTITITAQAGSGTPSSDSLTVDIVGTTLTLSGPDTVGLNDSADYTLTLTDSEQAGIAGVTYTANSSAGNGISSTTSATDLSGTAVVTLSADNAGADTLTVGALGLSTFKDLVVSNDQFAFVPLVITDIVLNTPQQLQLLWINGTPVSGAAVNFYTTRGTLSSNIGTTNGAGIAVVDIESNNSGPAVVTAEDPISGITANISLDFIATDAATVNLQASPTNVGVGEQSIVTAQVLDPNNNLVKNKEVTFELTDSTGGQISVARVTTDSFGIARTTYTGGNIPSLVDGVSIRATTLAADLSIVEDFVFLTVAGEARDITIGTGNTLIEIPDSIFAKEWTVIVKDGVGNPVPDSDVQVRLLPTRYAEGWFSLPDPITEPLLEGWIQRVQTNPPCVNEDPLYTGVISDPSVVDENNNGKIDPGTDAVVAGVDPDAAPGSACTFDGFGSGAAAADIVTNANGLARVCVYYTEDFALWLEVNIEARTNVSGTEFSANNIHWLPMSADDRNNESASPANAISPYGIQNDCALPDP